MAEEEGPTFLTSESVQIICYTSLAVAATTSFIILRKNPEFKFGTSAFFEQAELGFWVLLGKAIAKNSEENAENMTDFVTTLAETTTFHFNLPLFAAQACFLTVDRPVDRVSKRTSDILASAPFISYLTRIFGKDEISVCVDATIKTASLAALCYAVHQLGYPPQAYLFTALFLAEELSYYYSPRTVTVTLMFVNDLLYLNWLSGFNKD